MNIKTSNTNYNYNTSTVVSDEKNTIDIHYNPLTL